jgi:hypothetical protein
LENCPRGIAVEPEEELNEGDKGPTILKNKVVKAIKDMPTKKAICIDNIPVDSLKKLGDSE